MKKMIIPFLAFSLAAPALSFAQLSTNVGGLLSSETSMEGEADRAMDGIMEILRDEGKGGLMDTLHEKREEMREEFLTGTGARMMSDRGMDMKMEHMRSGSGSRLDDRMMRLKDKRIHERMKDARKENIEEAREMLKKASRLKDIREHKNAPAIAFLEKSGIIRGYDDGSFKPERSINRAELMKILVEGNGVSPTLEEFKECFPDVQQEWFAPYICYAKSQGWVSGYPDGTFRPGKTVIKVEALKMLAKAYALADEALADGTFSDVDGKAWYAPFLGMAHKRGLLEEMNGAFSPEEGMTRGKMSENLFRTIVLKLTAGEKFEDSSYVVADELAASFDDEEDMEEESEDMEDTEEAMTSASGSTVTE